MDLSRRMGLLERMKERGLRSWLIGADDETPEQRAGREAHIQKMADATGPKTTSVDVTEVMDDKLAALKEHVTQIAEDNFFVIFTSDEWREFQPTEDFTLRVSRIGVAIPEDDLFAGLPPEA